METLKNRLQEQQQEENLAAEASNQVETQEATPEKIGRAHV